MPYENQYDMFHNKRLPHLGAEKLSKHTDITTLGAKYKLNSAPDECKGARRLNRMMYETMIHAEKLSDTQWRIGDVQPGETFLHFTKENERLHALVDVVRDKIKNGDPDSGLENTLKQPVKAIHDCEKLNILEGDQVTPAEFASKIVLYGRNINSPLVEETGLYLEHQIHQRTKELAYIQSKQAITSSGKRSKRKINYRLPKPMEFPWAG